MSVSPARAAAFEILLKVEREQSYAGELLHSSHLARLSHADHGLATELVMGVLRWQSWLDRHVAQASSQKLERLDLEVLTALRLGAYQLMYLSRVPARAAIFESVELVKVARKRSAASFVNAVLRKLAAKSASVQSYQPGNETVTVMSNSPVNSVYPVVNAFIPFAQIERSDPATLAQSSSHPEWLVARWITRYGLETTRRICAYDQHVPATSIRIDDESALPELAADGIQLAPGNLLSTARTLLSGDITQSRAYRDGRIAIQDEGSQLVGLLVGCGKRILDCCAAPGGKTAVLAARNPEATILAADLHPHRARLLRELSRRPNIRVIAGDARQLPFASSFDRILADVPCSGTGTLARNPEIKWRLQAAELANLQVRQIAILRPALAQLSPGGRLVYSTCSLESEENEAVVEAILAAIPDVKVVDCRQELENLRHRGELKISNLEGLLDGPYLRTIPGVHPCDGFFAAIIERKI
jgi:16S rRNA (cytosine967-C5)-methyltransferase